MADVAVERVNGITLELDHAMQVIDAVDGRDLSFGVAPRRVADDARLGVGQGGGAECVAPQ